jgi:hypothetical protein
VAMRLLVTTPNFPLRQQLGIQQEFLLIVRRTRPDSAVGLRDDHNCHCQNPVTTSHFSKSFSEKEGASVIDLTFG